MPFAEQSWASFVALLNHRAREQPMQRALGFLADCDTGVAWGTFRQLDERARGIAARLQASDCPGQTALLLYEPGPEFVAAFLGCLYAGVIAVPVCLPRPRRPLTRLAGIAADAGVKLALTTGELLPNLSLQFRGDRVLDAVPRLATDTVDPACAGQWQPPPLTPRSVACLQYTSGSTANPKGVVLTHGNLLSNSRLIYDAFQHGPDSMGVIWLPPYHDMGLIGGILQPLYGGFPTVLMSPARVVQQPLRWLEAISSFRATTSGGPNFIYEACVDRLRAEDCQALDLSSWRVAFNGAEPIRAETLDRFAEKFAPFGFRREAFFPCYGLAEATLFVSGGPKASGTVEQLVSKASLACRRVAAPQSSADRVRVVGCGCPAADQLLAIVDGETLVRCAEGQIGEIWVSGPGVAQGYWRHPQETEETFHARLSQDGGERYLRTGDLGFVRDGQLFVTGRLKDLLIIDGRNYYPQDIERTVEACHRALRAHRGAAFAVDEHGEQLVVVHEVERNGRGVALAEVLSAIQQAVSEEHELPLHAVVLVGVGGVPKTPSGKTQRLHCRDLFLRGELPVLAAYRDERSAPLCRPAAYDGETRATEEGNGGSAAPCKPNPARGDSTEMVRNWLSAQIARRLKCGTADIDIRQPLASYGLKSRDTLEITAELEQWLGRRLSPILLYHYPTIESLADHLAGDGESEVTPASLGGGRALASEPIAIVGLGCRLPGASNPDAFWRLLCEGRDAISAVPADRWDADAVDRLVCSADTGDTRGSVRWGGWLPEIDRFDPGFFGISPREATFIDPQQRLLLEVAWESLADAGLPADRVRGSRAGVFVGLSTNDYRRQFMSRTSELDPYWATGNAGSIAANRISYFFDFRGPSVAVDTACSSSLVAVLWACQGLRAGECDLALAGGVNVILSPDISFSFLKAGGLAPDGRCRAFDAHAKGIVRSEGAGLVVLKRLSSALAEGDRIYAVIRGGAMNQDGRSNGITAPNQAAQEQVLRDAWNQAGISPGEAQYIETHGAGTLLGDVIEAQALRPVLATGRPPDRRCAIGSVKTNIGHCESAAGVAGLIKVALAIQHGQIPPNLHFTAPNPHIPFDEMPFFVPCERMPWPGQGGRRLAGVSSFGFGGTNAHLVVESPPLAVQANERDEAPVPPVHLLPLSAASRPALAEVAARWEDHLQQTPAPTAEDLADWCYHAAVRRTHLDHRAALHFRAVEDLAQQLAALRAGAGHAHLAVGRLVSGRAPRIAFVFSGHGGQWLGMHRPLCDGFPAFRAKLQECDALLQAHADWSLLTELDAGQSESRIEHGDVEISQTCLFAFQVALADAWRGWGIEPAAVVGHSMGEVAAAHAAGAITLPDAVRIIVQRSRVLQQALQKFSDGGAMAALRVSAEQAAELIRGCEDRVWIAVHNSPSYTVLSGDREVLEGLLARLRKQKIGGRLMNVPGAAHTPRLEQTGRQLQAALEGIQPQAARIPFYSTITGELIDGRQLDAAYWGNTVCRPVQFAPAIDRLSHDGFRAFVELGPHPLLTAAVTQCVEHCGEKAVVLPSLRRDDCDREAMVAAVGALFAHGVRIDWQRLNPNRRRWVSLPAYPWQRQRCWIEPAFPAPSVRLADAATAKDAEQPSGHLLLGPKIELAVQTQVHYWETRLCPARHPILLDYQLDGRVVLPVAAYAEAAVAAARSVFHRGGFVLDHMEFSRALVLPPEGEILLQVVLEAEGPDHAAFRFFSRTPAQPDGETWRLHVSGRVRSVLEDVADRRPCPLEQIRQACQVQVLPAPDRTYQRHVQSCAPAIRHVARLWSGEHEALGQIRFVPAADGKDGDAAFRTPLIDACCSVMAAVRRADFLAEGTRFGVAGLGDLRWYADLPSDAYLWSHATLQAHTSNGSELLHGSVRVWDESERLILEAGDVCLRRFAVSQPRIPRPASVPNASPSPEPPATSVVPDLLQSLYAAPVQQRAARLQAYLRGQLAHTLDLPETRIDVEQPLTNLGIDSLMAMEIKSRVEGELGVDIPIVHLLEGPTISKLADQLLPQLAQRPAGPPNPEPTETPDQTEDVMGEEATQLLQQLDGLPDDKVDALMHRMLAHEGRDQ